MPNPVRSCLDLSNLVSINLWDFTIFRTIESSFPYLLLNAHAHFVTSIKMFLCLSEFLSFSYYDKSITSLSTESKRQSRWKTVFEKKSLKQFFSDPLKAFQVMDKKEKAIMDKKQEQEKVFFRTSKASLFCQSPLKIPILLLLKNFFRLSAKS